MRVLLGGSEPYDDDHLRGLLLIQDGLRWRVRLVLDAFRDAGVPLVVTLADGDARHVEDTVAMIAITEALSAAVRRA